MSKVLALRRVWPIDFPDVIIHSELAIRNRHLAYDKAKTGDAEAAIALVRALLSREAVELLQRTIGPHDVTLAGVAAIEKTGFNTIPDAMELEIGQRRDVRGETLHHHYRRACRGVARDLVRPRLNQPDLRALEAAQAGTVTRTGDYQALLSRHARCTGIAEKGRRGQEWC